MIVLHGNTWAFYNIFIFLNVKGNHHFYFIFIYSYIEFYSDDAHSYFSWTSFHVELFWPLYVIFEDGGYERVLTILNSLLYDVNRCSYFVKNINKIEPSLLFHFYIQFHSFTRRYLRM